MLPSVLAHPLARKHDLDSPETTSLRRAIIQNKTFLKRIYDEWYGALVSAIPAGQGRVLELGSGAGFLRERIPDLLTSDILDLPGVDMVVDARRLPFRDQELRAIVMTNVLHHLPDIEDFFDEAARCVRPGGRMVMVEPWVTTWSRFVYTKLHHEPFAPEAKDWSVPDGGPLSAANGALPWILFERDRARFTQRFPQWCVEKITPTMPFRYLLSGGVSFRSFTPGFTFGMWRWIESCMRPWHGKCAMFAHVVLVRADF